MNTKNRLKVAIAVLLMLGMSASSAMAASPTGKAEASVVEQISIFQLTELSFGTMLQSNTGGTISLTPKGDATSSGVQLVSGTQRAVFLVIGDFNRAYTTTLDPSVDLIGPVGATPMNATLTNDNDGVFFQGEGDPILGIDELFIGGTLTVGRNQIPGVYSGTYNVTVDY